MLYDNRHIICVNYLAGDVHQRLEAVATAVASLHGYPWAAALHPAGHHQALRQLDRQSHDQVPLRHSKFPIPHNIVHRCSC